MASITSVISIFVLLLAAYCSSLPVNSAIDGSTPAIEVTTGRTMGDHGNNAHLHLATEDELKKMPKEHGPRASAERDSAEVTSTVQPATADQDTSSPMTSTTKTPSTEKTNGKRAYYITSYASPYRLYAGSLATSSMLADGTVLTHGPIYTNGNLYTDNSLVSYVTSYKRELIDEVPQKEGESSKDKQKDKRDYILERNLLTPMIDSFGRIFDVESPLSKHVVITRDLKDDGSSTPENPSKEGESSTDKQKQKQKRDYVLERSLLTPMIDSLGRIYQVQSPLSEHYVITRDLKDDGSSTPETPSKEGESSADKQKQKRDYILERNLLTPMIDSFGRIFDVESPLSKHVVFTSRDLKDDGSSTPETPSKEGETSTDKQKQKRDYILQHNYLRLMSDSRGQLYQVESPLDQHYVITRDLKNDMPSTPETPSKEGESSTDKQKAKRDYILERNLLTPMINHLGQVFDVEEPLSKHYVFTSRDLKDDGSSTPETPSKEGETSTDKQKDKRALYYEDSTLVRLADGTIGRGSILSHGSVLSNGVMLTHGPIYSSRNMLANDRMFIDGVARTYVSVEGRGIKDQTNDKDASKEENSSTTGDKLATTMETSTDFEPRAINPMDGQSGEQTSTPSIGKMPGNFGGNKNEKDGSSEESHSRLPQKQQPGKFMPNIADQSKEQKPDVNVPGSKQPINKT